MIGIYLCLILVSRQPASLLINTVVFEICGLSKYILLCVTPKKSSEFRAVEYLDKY